MSGQSNGYGGGYQPQYGGPQKYQGGNMGMSQQPFYGATQQPGGFSMQQGLGKYGGGMGMSQQPQFGNGGMMGGSFSPQESAALAAESARLYGNRTPQQQPSAWDAMQQPGGSGVQFGAPQQPAGGFGAPDGGYRPPPSLTPPPIIPNEGVRGQPTPLPPPIQPFDGNTGGAMTQWQGMPQYPGSPPVPPKATDQPQQLGGPTLGQGLLNRKQPMQTPWQPDPGYGNPGGDTYFGR